MGNAMPCYLTMHSLYSTVVELFSFHEIHGSLFRGRVKLLRTLQTTENIL